MGQQGSFMPPGGNNGGEKDNDKKVVFSALQPTQLQVPFTVRQEPEKRKYEPPAAPVRMGRKKKKRGPESAFKLPSGKHYALQICRLWLLTDWCSHTSH